MNKKYQYGTEENKKFVDEIRDDILNFGHKFPSPGGSSYYLGDDGTPWVEKDRPTWITCRMTHVYSLGALIGHEGSEELIDQGLKALKGELKDNENGGWYEALRQDGSFVPNKQCYAHAFVILATASALAAKRPGAQELLEEALKLHNEKYWDEKEGLTCDTWNTEFTVLDDYRGVNANMHTVEAYLAVADVTGDELYRTRAGRIIKRVVAFAKDNQWRIPEHYTKEWVPDLECNKENPADQFKPYGATPGHGIEWARLTTQWTLSSGLEGKEKEEFLTAAQNLYNTAIKDAWNSDGARGIVYTTDWEGNPIVHDRMHWTLAEAINTSAVLLRVTNSQKYADDYAQFMQYLDENVLDHVNGSWFHQLDQNNKVIGTVWPGKSDIYHALQSMMIPYHAIDLSIVLAVKKEVEANG